MLLKRSAGLSGGASRQRVGINAHLLSGEAGYRRAGIHHYIAQVLRYLPCEEDGLDYTVFTRHQADFLHRPGLATRRSRWPTERRLVRIAWEQLAWPWLAMRQRLSLLHSMAFVTPVLSPCPSVVTVYDLSFVYFPDRFPAWQQFYLQRQTARSCRQARRVITISESSRQDVHHFLGAPLAKIDVVHPGVDDVYRPLLAADVEAFCRHRGLERFILHVGTLQPRKNIPTLIEAFARLPDPTLQLVLVGGKGWLFAEIYERVKTLGLQERVRFTGYVPDDELPFWYNAADLLVFPSVYEGFGMPVVEAMACGTPVVAAESSSIPEAAGAAGLLFLPYDVAGLAERMAAVLSDAALSSSMRQKGLEQARHFSWERAGRETAAVYRRALREV